MSHTRDKESDAHETTAESSSGSDGPMYVVGIGASAGGLDPLERFFESMPVETGMAFVVVQHLSPDFKSLMNELLGRRTKIPIYRVEDGMVIKANAIYLIPPKKNMVLEKGVLRLMEQEPTMPLHLPIDIFFRSLALDAGNRAVAVVLSGTGSDGSRGIRDVHNAGGLVIVQSSESAAFDGMPRNALASGVTDIVTSPAEIPGQLLDYVSHSGAGQQSAPRDDPDSPLNEMSELYRLFREEYGIDFSFYRNSTIERRLDRRLRLSRANNLKSYLAKLYEDSSELETLYRDMLVEVTSFFRDKESYEVLAQTVIPDLIKDAEPNGEIRVWAAGCATGEEAYSLAMLCHHCREKLKSSVDIKVFATDVHQRSLETASDGVYSYSAVSGMPEEYRNRYFVLSGELFHVSKELRQMVIFAPHDLTKDPPFTRIDLISCRNVLIYLEPRVQQKILALFHFGLNVGGALFLGPSESLGDLEKEFETVNLHWRVYRKLRNVRLPQTKYVSMSQPLNTRTVVNRSNSFVSHATRPDKSWLVPDVYEQLLKRYVPPSLLVNVHLDLVHSFGDARKFLRQPEGRPTMDVTKMVEGDLRMAISSAVHRAAQSGESIVYEGVRVQTESGEATIKLFVEPYLKSSEKMYLICMEEMVPPEQRPEPEVFSPNDGSVERMELLERELAFTKESLQATVEELETSNEELQATNEELVASNEELQSTNEELHGGERGVVYGQHRTPAENR